MTAASSAGAKSVRAASSTRTVAVMHVTQPPGTGRMAKTERAHEPVRMNAADPTVRGGERRSPIDRANDEVPRGNRGSGVRQTSGGCGLRRCDTRPTALPEPATRRAVTT